MSDETRDGRDEETARDDRMRAAEQALEEARAAYESAREAAHRARHDARAAAREASRAERDERREERRRGRAGWDPTGFNFDLGPLSDLGGEEHTEQLEKTFAVAGAARLRVRNVSGETRIAVGPAGSVRVRARKRVRTTSAEKAKRLLENVEVRIDQDGDEIDVRPHLYEQDRGWLDLFKGGRVAVDFDITVPREASVEAQTVSGDLTLAGTRGPVEVQSVSGDLSLSDLRGSLRIKTVSGDASCTECVGHLEANSVSGDLTLERCRLSDVDCVSVSGDVTLDGDLAGQSRIKTISGDVELGLLGRSFDVTYKTTSGDLSSSIESATVTKQGRREQRVVIDDGSQTVQVKTVSGDLRLRPAGGEVPEAEPAPAAAAPVQEGPAEWAGEPEAPPLPPGLKGRVLRIQVLSGGKSRVNIAIPLAIARMGKAKLAASGLVRGHLAKFGIDLDDLLRQVEQPGPIVDIADNEDRVLILVE